MDIGSVLIESIELLWRRKFLWLLGLFMGLNSLVFSLVRIFLRGVFPGQWFEIDYWLNIIQTGTVSLPDLGVAVDSDRLWLYLSGGFVILFLYVVVFWIIVTVAEGAIIGAANEEGESRPSSFGSSVRLGFSYLKRFAAIDAAVFLPLFLWMVFMLLIALLDTILVAYMTLQTEAESNTVIAVFTLGWLCVLTLGCLIFPITLVSIWYRTLAFRDSAILDHGVREALQHTRHIIKRRFGEILVITIILYGLSYVLGWLLGFLSLPIMALTAVPLATGLTSMSGFLATGANLLMTLLVALLKGIVHAFTAVAWTLAYRNVVVDD